MSKAQQVEKTRQLMESALTALGEFQAPWNSDAGRLAMKLQGQIEEAILLAAAIRETMARAGA